jgi:hypothetical protein
MLFMYLNAILRLSFAILNLILYRRIRHTELILYLNMLSSSWCITTTTLPKVMDLLMIILAEVN